LIEHGRLIGKIPNRVLLAKLFAPPNGNSEPKTLTRVLVQKGSLLCSDVKVVLKLTKFLLFSHEKRHDASQEPFRNIVSFVDRSLGFDQQPCRVTTDVPVV